MKLLCYALLIAFCTSSMAERLIINTEEYAPLSYTEEGILKGIATEQVERIMLRAGVAFEMKVYPWARAYHKALTEKNTCVFTTSHTPERSQSFKWVEPLSLNMSVLVKLKSRSYQLSSLNEAKHLRIGVQNEDVASVYLKNNGFSRLDRASDADKSVLKLKANRVDLVAMAESRYLAMVETGQPIEKVMDIFAIKMGLACNPSVRDPIIDRLQYQLDLLIADGTQQAITKQYQPKP
ncbi:substrate-binding periplasmic protein [Vibrio ostreicida]|uniref:Transporter substrate-binding domain-containing protein n=1 Tax=Vibrio ostreicida TaxID=526588 RepID=A0ABT8BY12_9VIBR|nr:transporter substrate-binding domain-containing protein [Vibrio ostreicida]MDN3611913.1 transporter substrate-binding domain-containing protein [Vibrio ostreicida]NPD08903.1 transporter substrate-binding domain-containing protein [Vibrio ostreicida]